ncbi:MAG TPA: insulinase family protein, partial [Anaerolineaceae bacterium]|nr:insulinase family protein [Anaerolineaceae bacterium]
FDPEEVERERTVVISERQGNENSPQFRLGEEVQAAAFRVHPYHHEIIGDLADLERMTHEDLYRHYRTYYIPNNAVLAVAGDFQTEAMLRQIEAAFGAIPAGPEPPRLVRPEPPQRGERRVVVEGPGETAFLEVAYHAPKAADSDFFPFLVLDSLLTGPSNLNISGGISNRTSRLYRRLVEGEIAASVSGGFQATLDPFLFSIAVTLRPDRRPEEALQTIDEEVRRLQDEPPPADEVARAVKQARALFAYGSESTTNLGFWLGFSSMVAQVDWFLTFLDRLAEVTPQEVQRMAQAYLRPQNRVVGTYLPTNHAVEVHHE